MIRRDTTILRHPEQLLTYRNDSLMLVLSDISIEDKMVTNISLYNFLLFKKPKK